MVEIDSEILEKAANYLELVKGKGIDIISAYIFGSYARNDSNELSDIDIAIVSDSFEGNQVTDFEKIIGLSRKIDSRISPYTLNRESLDSYFVQSEIINKGIKIS